MISTLVNIHIKEDTSDNNDNVITMNRSEDLGQQSENV